MSDKIRPLWVIALILLVSPAAFAVDLVGAHDLALKSDPRLQAAEYRRMATDETKKQAWANLLPDISAGANVVRGNSEVIIGGQTLSDDKKDTYNWDVTLIQSLYRQSNYERLDIARGQISQAEAVYQIAFQDFLIRVADRYFLVLTNIDGVTFAEAEEKAFQRQFEQAEQRFEVGLTAITDVHEARATYDNARARAIVARNDLADAKEQMRAITGQHFDAFDRLQDVLPLVEPNPSSVAEWVERSLRNNPSVLSAQAGVEIADSNMRLERAGHYPTLDLVASVTRFTNDNYIPQLPVAVPPSLKVNDEQIMLLLDIPLYQGGRVSSRTRQAKLLMDATSSDLDDVQRSVVRDAENAFRAVLAGIQEVEAFKQAQISAQSALEATQAGFEVGTRTIVDVLIAEQNSFQALRNNSFARHAYILRHLRLKSVAGELNSEDLRIVNQLLE